jgi:hypothetical protein
MKRLQPTDDLTQYTQIKSNDPYTCEKATAFMVTPSTTHPGWDDVIYYRHNTSPNISYISKSRHTTRVRVDFKD